MSTPSPAAGFVLAGGKSRRMGTDKALLAWNGQTLLEHMTGLLHGVCDPVQVVGRDDLPDSVPDLGVIGGIATALEHTTTENNLIVAVDLPLLTHRLLKHLKESLERSDRPLVVCNIGSAYPLCLGVRRVLLGPLHAYIASARRSLHGFIDTVTPEIIEGFGPDLFRNINTPADYEAVRKR